MYNYPEPWDVDIEQLDTTVLTTFGGEPYGVKFECEPTMSQVVLYPQQLLRRGYKKIGTIIPGNGFLYYIWERSSSVHWDASLAGLCIHEEGSISKYFKTEYQFNSDSFGDSAWKLCRKYCILLKRGILYREREKAARSGAEGGNREREMEAYSFSFNGGKVGRDRRRVIHTLREEFGMDPQEMFSPEGLRGFWIPETEEPVALRNNRDREELHSPSLSRTNASRDLSQNAEQMVGRIHVSENSPYRRNRSRIWKISSISNEKMV